jgi:hypothetical protein
MTTVRITGTTLRNIHNKKWLGAPIVDPFGRIQRSLDLPEGVYRRIEKGIAAGSIEGTIYFDDGRRFDWYLDRPRTVSASACGTGFAGDGEGI